MPSNRALQLDVNDVEILLEISMSLNKRILFKKMERKRERERERERESEKFCYAFDTIS